MVVFLCLFSFGVTGARVSMSHPSPRVVNELRYVFPRSEPLIRAPRCGWRVFIQAISRRYITRQLTILLVKTLNQSLASTLNVPPDCHKYNRKSPFKQGLFRYYSLVPPVGLEPTTKRIEAAYSNPLSYGGIASRDTYILTDTAYNRLYAKTNIIFPKLP